MTRRWVAAEAVVTGLLAWMFLACCFPLSDTDLFWHLKTGEWMLQQWSIPGYDLYTYTDSDRRWIDLHWGFQIIVACLYRMGGAELLVLVKAAMLTAVLGIGCYTGGAGLRDWQRVLCWLLPAITISGRGYERPEVISLACLAVSLFIMARLERRPHWIWYLPVLQVCWINCHVLFILGLAVGGCYVIDYGACSIASGWWRRFLCGECTRGLDPGESPGLREALQPRPPHRDALHQPQRPDDALRSRTRNQSSGASRSAPAPGAQNSTRSSDPNQQTGANGLSALDHPVAPVNLAYASILSVVAALMNPYFEEGALFPLVVFRKFTAEQQDYATIGEFQSPVNFLIQHGFANLYLDAEIVLWVAAAISFLALLTFGRISIFRTLLFAAFSYLAWKASRNTNIFSLVAGFVLAENVGEICIRAKRGEQSKSDWESAIRWGLGSILAVMSFAVITGEWNRRTEQVRPFRLGEARAWYAHDAAKFMGRPGFPKQVFASNFGVASVYTYHNGPEGKVFMDGRLEVCSLAIYRRYREVCRQMAMRNPIWVELLRDSEGMLPAVMLDSRYSRQEIEGVIQTTGWRLVYADQAAAVFFDERTADALDLPAVSHAPLLYPPKL